MEKGRILPYFFVFVLVASFHYYFRLFITFITWIIEEFVAYTLAKEKEKMKKIRHILPHEVHECISPTWNILKVQVHDTFNMHFDIQ
jgi:hypothetical protein